MTIYGTDIFSAVKTALYDRLNGNLAALQLLDPPVNAVYAAHNEPSLVVPAVSVDLADADQLFTGAADNSVQYNAHFTVRVHSAYRDGFFDHSRAMQQANSVLNYIREIPELATGITVRDIPRVIFNQQFAETTTQGTEIYLTIESFVIDEV